MHGEWPLTRKRRSHTAYDLLCASGWRTGEDDISWEKHAASVRRPPFRSGLLIANVNSTMHTVQGYLTPVRNAISNPSSLMSRTSGAAESTAQTVVNNPESLVNRVRNLDSATLVSASIVAAETIGFFCVGEMIGRLKIVGYRGGHSEHH